MQFVRRHPRAFDLPSAYDPHGTFAVSPGSELLIATQMFIRQSVLYGIERQNTAQLASLRRLNDSKCSSRHLTTS